jgi:hypothetical protein
MPDDTCNGSDRIEPAAAERATATGMADLLAMVEKISRLEAAQAGVTASPADDDLVQPAF